MKKPIKVFLIVFCALLAAVLFINFYVKLSEGSRILDEKELSELDDVDCIIVLGAGLKGSRPSHMLEDRLLGGISLYENGVAPKLLMSGDHGREDYDEVNVMKAFAIEHGVPSEDIFMDHAGFSTYESIYRAKEVFCAEKIVIVTQEYHLSRALYIADSLGLEAYGFPSDPRTYRGQFMRDLREIAARNKDFFTCIFKPEPTYLGDAIAVSGNGDITNDKA